MFISVGGGEEGEEDLLVPAEILGDQRGAAFDIVQDRAMMLHDATRGAAGARGVDDAGEVAALEVRARRAGRDVAAGRGQRRPIVELDIALLPLRQRLDADHMFAGRAHDRRREQRLLQFCGRDDRGAGAAVVQDMLVIALGIGGVGRHRHAARGHDREVGNQPFGAVFGDEHDPVAGVEAEALQRAGEARHATGGLVPGERGPHPRFLRPQERRRALFPRAGEEHGDEIREMFELFAHRPSVTAACCRSVHAS